MTQFWSSPQKIDMSLAFGSGALVEGWVKFDSMQRS